MLTESEYRALRARIDAMNAWVDTKRGRNGWASYKPDEVPEHLRPEPTNDDRGAVEAYEFVQNPPDKYFAYVQLTDPDPMPRTIHHRGRTIGNVRDDSGRRGVLSTFPGTVLGSVQCGREWRDSFGGTRVPITVDGINGRRYVGTYYKSSGSYARIRLSKAKGTK